MGGWRVMVHRCVCVCLCARFNSLVCMQMHFTCSACSTHPLHNPAVLFGEDSRIHGPGASAGCGLKVVRGGSCGQALAELKPPFTFNYSNFPQHWPSSDSVKCLLPAQATSAVIFVTIFSLSLFFFLVNHQP